MKLKSENKFLLVAVNAKYIHSNPGMYSLKAYADKETGGDTGQSITGGDTGQDVTGGGSRWQVEIGEYTINNQMELILEDIYRRKPEVVGISCYIWNITYALELVRDLHKVLPDTDIWLGGPEVSFDAPGLLAREPEVLGVMKGEGEETFAGLLRCYGRLGMSVRAYQRQASDRGNEEPGAGFGFGGADFWKLLESLPGLTFRADNGAVVDKAVRPVMDMSRIPFLYHDLKFFDHRIIYYESSRGCPFSCSYCLSSIDKSVRFRDLELVKRELDFFLENKVPQVKFVDRTFNCKKSHAEAVWRHILERDNGITNFHFEIAADLLDEEELDLISRMRPGLIQLEIGVQSTNPETIREIHRRMDLDKVKEVVARINAGHNVHQHLDLIAGLPCEDLDSFHRSFNEVYAMAPEQLQLGFLKVLKGSYMFERAADYDLVYRTLPPYEVLSTRWLPYDDVLKLKGVEEMVEVYYNSRQYTRTLKLLETLFEDAFTLFERLSRYYEENALTGLNHSRIARYEILHEFIRQTLRENPARGERMREAEDALLYDLYLRENAKSRPSFAPDQTPYKDRIRRKLPELRILGSQVHAEVMQSGELLVFDYRVRDPLTGNAQVTEEDDHGRT